jgi:hypothetical protein
MASQKEDPRQGLPAAPTISELLEVTPILPGESEASYRASLDAVIEELGAKTSLQVYLAEKIHDCLWWIRRYEDQKRTTIIAEMARQVRERFTTDLTQKEIDVRDELLADNITKDVLKAFAEVGHGLESVRQLAYSKKHKEIFELDQQIALQVKILASFQGSYEVAFNRKLNVERLRLQNELMRRDLAAVDVNAISAQVKHLFGEAAQDDKSQKARRKSR